MGRKAKAAKTKNKLTKPQAANQQMLAETVPPKILPRILTKFDLVTIYFAIVFGAYGAAQLAANGWASIPILILAAVTFLLPCALAAYELGTLFPSEGGVYVWTYKTFGPLNGFIAGWLSWAPIFLLLPINATVITSLLQYAFDQQWSLPWLVAAQIAFVWVLLGVSVLRLKTSQSLVRVVFFIAIVTAIAAFVAGILHSPHETPVNNEIYSFDRGKYGVYGAVYAAAVLWLLGVEVPFNMGAEFSDHKRTAHTMLIWGTIALLLGYIIGIVGILFTTPVDKIDPIAGIAKAVGTVFPTLGKIIAIGVSFAVFTQATSVMNAYSRLVFIGGIEKRVPSKFAEVSKGKTPWPAMLLQAIGVTIVILIFAKQPNKDATYLFYLAGSVAVWCASLFYIYFSVLRARSRYSELYAQRGSEVWMIPGGKVGLWLCCIVGIIFNALAIYFVFANPWGPGISMQSWQHKLLVTSLVIILLGVLVFILGKKKAEVMQKFNY